MAKPEPWRLDRASYPFGETTETRFQDLDPLGHVNNVAMAALFENGRVRFNRAFNFLDRREEGERWLIVALAINYVAEAYFPDDVEIASGVGRVGASSWTIFSAAFQNGRCVATCDATLAFTDQDGAKPLPATLHEKLDAYRAAPV